jgi:hypothetical protein
MSVLLAPRAEAAHHRVARLSIFLLLAGASGLASSGCADELWPIDGGEPALGVCLSRRAPPSGEERIAAGATDQEATVVDLTLDARGEDFVGEVRLSHGVGTIVLGCDELPVVVYQAYGSEDTPGLRLFRALAVDQDRLYPIYLACQDTEPGVIIPYQTDGTEVKSELMQGSCAEVTRPVRWSLQFPALDLPLPPLLTGYRIEGPSITLGGDGKGTMALGATSYAIFAFEAGYQSIHLLLADRAAKRVSYAELYFDEGGESVDLRSGVTLPGFGNDVEGVVMAATFTIPDQ